MKKCVCFVFVLVALVSCLALGAEPRASLSFKNAPLIILTEDYAEKSGTTVEIVSGVNASFTFVSDKSLSLNEYLNLVKRKLKEKNIGLYPIATNRLVATWIDVQSSKKSTLPRRPTSYTERLRLRREELKKVNSSNKPLHTSR